MSEARFTLGVGGTAGPPADRLVSRSRSAEQQGFTGIWWPDHLMGWIPSSIWTEDISTIAKVSPSPDVYFDPVAAISAAATSTETVTLGTCVTDPIRRPPAMLANEFLTLHHISKGRTILGLGAGEGENIVPYGMSYSKPVSKLEEALQVIRLLWGSGGEAVDFDGTYYQLDGAVLGMPTYKGTHPAIWIAANGPRMCGITGAHADGWLPVKMPVDDYRERLGWITESRAANGRTDTPFTAGMFSFMAIGEDRDEVDRLMDHPFVKGLFLSLPGWCFEKLGAEHPLGADFHGLASYVPSRLDRDQALRYIGAVPIEVVREYMLHGTPDDIIARLGEYADAGLQHAVLQNVGFVADLTTAASSFSLVAELPSMVPTG